MVAAELACEIDAHQRANARESLRQRLADLVVESARPCMQTARSMRSASSRGCGVICGAGESQHQLTSVRTRSQRQRCVHHKSMLVRVWLDYTRSARAVKPSLLNSQLTACQHNKLNAQLG
eukprot:450075-Pleurochrysis_carterae.AAC.12